MIEVKDDNDKRAVHVGCRWTGKGVVLARGSLMEGDLLIQTVFGRDRS